MIQSALDSWEHAARAYLEIDASPLAPIVLFDSACVWHLVADGSAPAEAERSDLTFSFAGTTLPVFSAAHEGAIALPNGARVPAQGLAFASLAEDGVPFFVLALLDVWRENPDAAKHEDLAELILGVVSHEIVHTRQLAAIARRVERLREKHALAKDVNDDIIEARYADVRVFAEAHQRESDLFYEAARAGDDSLRKELVRQALALVRERQARHYVGDDAVYRELEELFLNMEGVAVWVAFRLENERRATAPGEGWFARERNSWSQDEGLALVLLIDALVPGWKQRMLGEELASPFALLEEALSDGAG